MLWKNCLWRSSTLRSSTFTNKVVIISSGLTNGFSLCSLCVAASEASSSSSAGWNNFNWWASSDASSKLREETTSASLKPLIAATLISTDGPAAEGGDTLSETSPGGLSVVLPSTLSWPRASLGMSPGQSRKIQKQNPRTTGITDRDTKKKIYQQTFLNTLWYALAHVHWHCKKTWQLWQPWHT